MRPRKILLYIVWGEVVVSCGERVGGAKCVVGASGCCCKRVGTCVSVAWRSRLTFPLGGIAFPAHGGQRNIGREQEGQAQQGQQRDEDGREVQALLRLAVTGGGRPVRRFGSAVRGLGGAVRLLGSAVRLLWGWRRIRWRRSRVGRGGSAVGRSLRRAVAAAPRGGSSSAVTTSAAAAVAAATVAVDARVDGVRAGVDDGRPRHEGGRA